MAKKKHRHHIFVSYSRADRYTMRRLRDDLSKAGFTLCSDDTSLMPGTPSWMVALKQAIKDSGCLVVLLTPHAKKSIWVAIEYAYADAFGKPIFPVLVTGDQEQSVPEYLLYAQYADLTGDDTQMQKLVQEIRTRLKIDLPREAAPAPAFQLRDAPTQTALIDLLRSNPLGKLAQAAAQVSPVTEAGARACVFLIDPLKNELYGAAMAGEFKEAERQLRFRKSQGVVGDAWQRKRAIIADLSSITEEERGIIMNLTPEQISATRQVGSILGIPIFAKDDTSQVMGVLAIDSPLPLAESKPDRAEVMLTALEISRLVAQAL